MLGISSELLRRHADREEDAHRRAEETNQQDISYRDPSSTGRLAVGDRAPDALVPDTHDYLVDAVFNPTFRRVLQGRGARRDEQDAYAQPVPRLMPMLTSVMDPSR